MIDYDKIFSDLLSVKAHKTQQKIIKAQAEIDAITRESAAYAEGVFDAVEAIKASRPEAGPQHDDLERAMRVLEKSKKMEGS